MARPVTTSEQSIVNDLVEAQYRYEDILATNPEGAAFFWSTVVEDYLGSETMTKKEFKNYCDFAYEEIHAFECQLTEMGVIVYDQTDTRQYRPA